MTSRYIYIYIYVAGWGERGSAEPTGKSVSVSFRVRVVHAYEHEAKLRGRVRDDAFPLLVVVSGRFVLPVVFRNLWLEFVERGFQQFRLYWLLFSKVPFSNFALWLLCARVSRLLQVVGSSLLTICKGFR